MLLSHSQTCRTNDPIRDVRSCHFGVILDIGGILGRLAVFVVFDEFSSCRNLLTFLVAVDVYKIDKNWSKGAPETDRVLLTGVLDIYQKHVHTTL